MPGAGKIDPCFSDRYPDKPLVVLLAGTDIYKFQHSHPEDTLSSMNRATELVCLHELVHRAIPKKYAKTASDTLSCRRFPLRAPSTRWFETIVAGHLRDEKDLARFTLPEWFLMSPGYGSSILEKRMTGNGRGARREMRSNPRYIWQGEVPGWQVRHQFARSHAMVISSVMEGGANIVSEAIVCGVPVIASRTTGTSACWG